MSKFAEGISMNTQDVLRVSREVAAVVRFHLLELEAIRIRRFMAMPWYRRWWAMVRGR